LDLIKENLEQPINEIQKLTAYQTQGSDIPWLSLNSFDFSLIKALKKNLFSLTYVISYNFSLTQKNLRTTNNLEKSFFNKNAFKALFLVTKGSLTKI